MEQKLTHRHTHTCHCLSFFFFISTHVHITYKGGLLAHSTGFIYAFPAHSNEVLCVDSNPDKNTNGDEGDQSWRVSTIPIQRHENDTDPHDLQYKWLGGSYGADGWYVMLCYVK